MVRGDGQYLYDVDGNQYLDCVNNVPQVGHSHPTVVEAACRQMSVLNTNTRYLYEPLVNYAERLSSLLPEPLRVCFFVNSGSEANELALRLARAHTGRRGVVTLDGAYHGHTNALVDISPYKFDGPGGEGCPPHVQVAPTPDPYRGQYRNVDAGQRYATAVQEKLDQACAAGYPAGAFFAEPLMGCAGQIAPPPGFLDGAFAAARGAGAVCVADEVQIGFGRVGTQLWGFETQAAFPDIVTLGKPMGNGHPVGAVVTTPDVAASFETGMEYFNTFGGNTVSCAVGMAVLDVIEREGLQQHAHEVGSRLMSSFQQLAQRHAVIGDVRGSGLFLGVELISDPESRTPAGGLARDLVTRTREEGILLSTEGPGDNVLKIKPPLQFTATDADRLTETLDRLLT